MTVTHIDFNANNSKQGNALRNAISQLENGYKSINDVIGMMALMIDGDGSSPIHYAYMRTKFGFANDNDAKAAWEELLSLQAKLITDSNVTNVNAALLQAFNKFR